MCSRARACVWPRLFQALCECVLSGPVIEVVLGRGGSFPEGICPEWGRLCLETKQEGAQVRSERLSTAQWKHDTNWTDRTRPRRSKTMRFSHYITYTLYHQFTFIYVYTIVYTFMKVNFNNFSKRASVLEALCFFLLICILCFNQLYKESFFIFFKAVFFFF